MLVTFFKSVLTLSNEKGKNKDAYVSCEHLFIKVYILIYIPHYPTSQPTTCY